MRTFTPLRYPGGKAKIYNIVKKIIETNNLANKVYVEPFSGGFGLGLKLLMKGDIHRVIINDYDQHIYAFWKCVFCHTTALISKIETTNITIEEWKKQKNIYENFHQYSLIDVGFSTLFLNRTNYSGILKSGPIGGMDQKGEYKIDCRFNKFAIVKLIKSISQFRRCVEIYNYDAIKLIKKLKPREHELFYNFDPPYVNKGKELYLNSYNDLDHIHLKEEIKNLNTEWIMTYDNCELIRNIYSSYSLLEQELNYSVYSKRKVYELMIFSNNMVI